MDRRSFFGSVGVVLAGLVTRNKVVGKSVPILEGLTDEQMGEIIARFPQYPEPVFMNMNVWRDLRSIEIYKGSLGKHSMWRVEGVTIHATTDFWKRTEIVDIRGLHSVRIMDREWSEYRRISGNWFTLDSSLADPEDRGYRVTAVQGDRIIDGRVDKTVYRCIGPEEVQESIRKSLHCV